MTTPTRTPATRRHWIRTGIIVTVIAVLAGGLMYWRVQSTRVFIDSSMIQAPSIALSAAQPGTLEAIYVQPGDIVAAEQPVAQVGTGLVKAKIAGVIISIDDKVGAQVNPNEPVVTMIDPNALRVVGKIDEDKGYSRITVGDQVTFTVDALGGTQFSGVIDEVSPTSEQSGIVFSISDKREVKQFDVKARFDVQGNPGIKNGMSARLWVYTN